MYTNQVNWETLRSINSTSLTGAYQAVGTPLAFQSYKLKMVNNSTSLVTVSINGTTDIDVLPPNSFWLYDESALINLGIAPTIPAGTQIFVKGAAGTGLIYLVTQYIVTN